MAIRTGPEQATNFGFNFAHALLELLARHRSVTDPVPPFEHNPRLLKKLPSDATATALAVNHPLEVTHEMRPADLPEVQWQPRVRRPPVTVDDAAPAIPEYLFGDV
jgi:hypothetical protein